MEEALLEAEERCVLVEETKGEGYDEDEKRLRGHTLEEVEEEEDDECRDESQSNELTQLLREFAMHKHDLLESEKLLNEALGKSGNSLLEMSAAESKDLAFMLELSKDEGRCAPDS